MSIESVRLEELGQELGAALASSSEHEAFLEAKTAVENDEEAQKRIREFEQLREEFMMARQVGQANQEDLEAVQEAQQKLHELPVMAEYLAAQSVLQDRLSEINEAISDPLAVDFGGEAGGCCHD
ncbi:MAG: YlbF family regulator [Halobacteriota archaeon]